MTLFSHKGWYTYTRFLYNLFFATLFILFSIPSQNITTLSEAYLKINLKTSGYFPYSLWQMASKVSKTQTWYTAVLLLYWQYFQAILVFIKPYSFF